MRRAACSGLLTIIAAGALATGTTASAPTEGAQYTVVKVCSLLSLAEVKKLAPWPPHVDAIAKAEEEPIGPRGSSCNYPSADVQVMSFQQGTIDSLKKSGKLEPVTGVGDEAYLRNNRDRYAELYARVGPHLVTVQYNIGTGEKFDVAKARAVEIGKALAAKLR